MKTHRLLLLCITTGIILTVGFFLMSFIGYRMNQYNDLIHPLLLEAGIAVLAIVSVIAAEWNTGRTYEKKVINQAMAQELEYRKLLQETTEELYENVYELDITHDRAVGKRTREKLERLGISEDLPYEDAILIIAEAEVKEEFRDNYLRTFSRENVLNAYRNGQSELKCDVMLTQDDGDYHWSRIRARIFFWNSDQSVRMIVYRQNIADEKKQTEYQNLLREATEGLYESVHEVDITNDRANGERTRQYFASLGIDPDASFREALLFIAENQVKQEFRKKFLDTFLPENVLRAYQNKRYEVSCDFMSKNDSQQYSWIRIRARLFYWEAERAVWMITYRQDITAEKMHEFQMMQMVQTDPLSGLANKEATREKIGEALRSSSGDCIHAFLMIDIDQFKKVNDSLGHGAGDLVIKDFGARLKEQFRAGDVCGRVGGDEFAVLMQNIPGKDWLINRLSRLTESLRETISVSNGTCEITASIGAALYPEEGIDFETLFNHADAALYQSKRKGRDTFTVYGL